DGAVPVQAEDQRDVDADTGGGGGRDSGQPLLGGRDLHEQIRSVDRVPQLARFGNRGVGVVRQSRIHLDGDTAVLAVRGLIGVPEDITGGTDIIGGQLQDGTVDICAGGSQLRELVVIGGAFGDR